MLSEEEIFESADDRIQKHRMGDVVVKVIDSAGNPVANTEIMVQQTKHAFLFGCNIFLLGQDEDEEKNKTYEEMFAALLNYATLPFYWGSFEPERDKPNYERLDWMAKRCKELGIVTKGHPLAWHEGVPDWAPQDITVLENRLKSRITDIVKHYKGLVNIWDAINEATVSARFDNPIGKWIEKYGDDVCVGLALDWAHEANPDALLLVNDFNVSPDYEEQLRRLQKAQKPFGAIGIQSHMHMGQWSLSRVWEVCETFSNFGLPIHFTELTVLSGELKTDHDWHKRRDDWVTTEEGEKIQLEYTQKLYRLLFSHPSVEAITWWNLIDGCWQGAPAGLLRSDLSPKPIYERLLEMVKGEWWTQIKGRTNDKGEYRVRGFCGEYDVMVRDSQESFTLYKGENNWTIKFS